MDCCEYPVRIATSEDWEEAMEMVWQTFLKFEGKDYSPLGVKNFLAFISDDKLYEMFINGDYKMWVAISDDNEIVGVGSLRSGCHVSLLFVKAEFHKRGIGRKILKSMQERAGALDVRLTVNAAPYALGFYEKIGFIRTKEAQVTDGIIYTPMTLLTKIK